MEAKTFTQSQNGEQLNRGFVKTTNKNTAVDIFVDGKDILDEHPSLFKKYASVNEWDKRTCLL